MVGKMVRNVVIGGVISALVVPKLMNMQAMSGMKKMMSKRVRMLNRAGRQMQRTAFKTFRTVKSIMA